VRHKNNYSVDEIRRFLEIGRQASEALTALRNAEKDGLSDLYNLGEQAMDCWIALDFYRREVPKAFRDKEEMSESDYHRIIGRCVNYVTHSNWYEENKDDIQKRREKEFRQERDKRLKDEKDRARLKKKLGK